MAVNKKNEFKDEEINQANFAKVLSHPARIALLMTIAQKQSCICGELVEELPLAQSTVSQHLKELKNAGLIQGTIEGPKTCYCINWEKLESSIDDFKGFFYEILTLKTNPDCC